MNLSNFGTKFSQESGITQLMEDLGAAISSDKEMLMLGGGNPAHLPEVQNLFRARMEDIMSQPNAFEDFIGNYDGPRGNAHFIETIAKLLQSTFGWDITTENIAITNGSQSSFFALFNLFAGKMPDGSHKKILLPITPEYIGYTDLGLSSNFFSAYKPTIQHLENRQYKYHINFDKLKVTPDIGAICISRPTNPTGNVLTNEEIHHLDQLAQQHNIPLIIDGAYGTPFPNAIYTQADPIWNPNTILCLSLSKFGLPNLRTGIVIAQPEVIKTIAQINGILSLAPSGAGARLAIEMMQSGDILNISQEIIKPTYHDKSEYALNCWNHYMPSSAPWHIHKPEGAFFHWLWFKDLPISSEELYQQLKARNTLVIPGHYFFPGLENENWDHKHQCIRVTYAGPKQVVERGIEIIADEIKAIY